jgi:erythronate-4-phosphate dehydrogenase
VRDATALLVRTRTRCDAALLDGSAVRFIGSATIGCDHIDMEWCAAHGITVAVAAGSNARGVLQWVAAALGWLASHPSVKTDGNDLAEVSSHRGLKPSETTLGVVGVGHVGSLVARYAAAWGFRVMCSDPPRERAEGLGAKEGFYPLSAVVAECDIITFHVPLTLEGADATRHLVNSDLVRAMKPSAVIINSSRGGVIEDAALTGRNYILDVWNGEPDIDRGVLERALLATPHIAGYSVQGKAAATAAIVDALARHFNYERSEVITEGAPAVLRSSAQEKATEVITSYERATQNAERREVITSDEQNKIISWEEMLRTMPAYFDIAAESAALKAAPEKFEQMRNTYKYRTEYF